MDPVLNPFSPGAGRRPAALVGRDGELASWRSSLRRLEQGRDAQPAVMFGLRGVGKTVLAGQMALDARDRGWWVAQAEAAGSSSLRPLLGEPLHDVIADLDKPSVGERLLRAIRTLASFRASYDASGAWNFGVDLTTPGPGGGADSGQIDRDLRRLLLDVGEAAREHGKGLAVVIDEAQDLSTEELAALCTTAHEAGQRNTPLALVLAGLPSLPRVLAEARSYAERLFTFQEIGALTELDTARALDDPVAAEGVSWEPEALARVADASGGYPYFIQQYGQEAWVAAEGSPITLTDANLGIARGQRALDTGFFRSRWDRATPAEKSYLRAMAEDADAPSNSGTVADRLGKSTSALGPVRAKLIAKGLIFAPEHNVVRFTVPTMASFVGRQPE